MKKIIVLASMVGIFVGMLVCPSAFAQHDMGIEADSDSGHAQCAMGGKKGMMGHDKMCDMMGGSSGRTVTATSDGGVVVMSGDQLYKYDKKLKFINQAQIPAGEDAMGMGMGMGMGMMGMGSGTGEGAMKTCPMMKADGSMMSSGDAAEAADVKSGSATSDSAVTADHPAHH